MAPPEPAHTGLRPLSPYGEGYCRVCVFVVGLDAEGRLIAHTRGIGFENPTACAGSGGKPPGVTPYASRRVAFRVTAPDVWCPECGQTVRSTRRGGVQAYDYHCRREVDRHGYSMICDHSYTAVGRNHGGERG